MECLVTMTPRVPAGTSERDVEDGRTRTREAVHTREPPARGRMPRLWRPPPKPGEWRTSGLFTADGSQDPGRLIRLWRLEEGRDVGLWRATGAVRTREFPRSLPMTDWLRIETVPLTRHPGDPGSRDSTPVTTPAAGRRRSRQ
ncbi:muconolactone Delta-isomerase family protein [Streptomyces sp. NPDC005799]|uniref:muconolactone Delta-isomerase family protein n=1 Tax=Streptomyces sp. NPDC005799 TaxID=3154678 RepID=UPI00340A7C4A